MQMNDSIRFVRSNLRNNLQLTARQNNTKMVLITSTTISKETTSSTMSTAARTGVKSLQEGDSSSNGSSHNPPTKKLSLLVDYSKRKAEIGEASSSSTINRRSHLFGSLNIERISREEVGDHIDRVLSGLDPSDSSSVSPEQDPLGDGSQHATTKGNGDDNNYDPISFRVRKSTIRVGRCKSFDEKKLSTYENLQKSLRNLMQEESEKEHSESSTSASDDDPIHRSMPAGGDRRLQLARMKRRNNHQSMRNLTTSTGSTRNLIMSLGGSEHGESTGRRPTLGGVSVRAASSRNLVRRSKTMPDKKPMDTVSSSRWHQPNTSVTSNMSHHHTPLPSNKGGVKTNHNKDSLSSASEHSYLKSAASTSKSFSTRRTSLLAMSESMPAGSNRRAALLRSNSGSRRSLLADSTNSASTTTANDASHFVTGSRIRRHGSLRNLIVEE